MCVLFDVIFFFRVMNEHGIILSSIASDLIPLMLDKLIINMNLGSDFKLEVY